MSAKGSSPYRDGAPQARPALWVPGVIFVENLWRSERATLHVGPEAGRWWVRANLRDWKREVLLVERRAIPEPSARSAGIALPEDLLDPERVPLARRAAATSPLLVVSPEDADPTWQVEAVQPWTPALPKELIQARQTEINAEMRRQRARALRAGCGALLGALALIALIVWLQPPTCTGHPVPSAEVTRDAPSRAPARSQSTAAPPPP